MGKFTRVVGVVPRKTKPGYITIRSLSFGSPDTLTYEGGAGWTRDPKSELFLLAVTNFVSEDTFYEEGKKRDDRFVGLIHQVTKTDPEWLQAFIPYLRDKLNMRSASIVAACEYIAAGGKNGRTLVANTLRRADEPAEALAYWLNTHGRAIPKPLKRGIADVVENIYNERNVLKWDSANAKVRMADVVELVHPTAKAPWQGALYKWLLDSRHDREVNTESLPMLKARTLLESVPVADRKEYAKAHPEELESAGITWESLSGWLQGPMDKEAWEAAIPQMGYMALLRNLRNFDDAGISDSAAAAVNRKLTDPTEIAASRQLPFRFYNAHKNVATLNWGATIELALGMALEHVPSLPGKTLILVDVSVSMDAGYSARSKAKRWELAALFGAALARRAENADLFIFSDLSSQVNVRPHASVLKIIDIIGNSVHGGTQTFKALRDNYNGHDRVIILTDEQAFSGAYGTGPGTGLPDVPIFTFNLAGYKAGHLPSGKGKMFTLGGLSDAAFAAIPMLEKWDGSDWSFLIG